MLLLKRWSHLSLVFLSLVVTSAQGWAAGLKPDARYLILIDGMEVSKQEWNAAIHFRTTRKDFYDDETTKAMMTTPVAAEIHKKISDEVTDRPFAILFRTDAQGQIMSALLFTAEREWAFGATGDKASTRVDNAVPPGAVPMPRPPKVEPKPAPVEMASVNQPAVPEPIHARFLVTVNRRASDAEKAANPRVVEAGYNDLLEMKYKDEYRQKILDTVRSEISRLGWEKTTFSIEWNESKSERLVGEVVLRSADQTIPIRADGSLGPVVELKDPEGEPADPNASIVPVAAAPLEDLLKTLEADPKPSHDEIVKNTVLFAVRSEAGALNCTVLDGNMQFSDPQVKRLLEAAGIPNREALKAAEQRAGTLAAAAELNRIDRLSVFKRMGGGDHCLKPLFENLWAVLVAERQNFLIWDFRHWLMDVVKHPDLLEYVGTEHSFKIEDAEIRNRVEFLVAILLGTESRQISTGLPLKFREWATTDTNSPEVNSRKEAIDLLGYYIGGQRYKSISDENEFGSVGRQAVIKGGIQHILMPERYAPKIVVTRAVEAKARELGGPAYVVFCGGGPLNIDRSELYRPVSTRLASSITLLDSEVRDLRNGNRNLTFSCGGVNATLSSPPETLSVQLTNPSGYRYQFGEDNSIKAVSTFPLVGTASQKFIGMMKAGTALAGYQVVSHDPTRDFKREFLEEMKESDFYFPAAHQTNGAEFVIGNQNGSKMVLEKKVEPNRTLRIVLFLPPTDRPAGNVVLADKEISEFFRIRREMAVQRRLTVMNVACGSKECVPHWMKAYRSSLGGKTYNLEEAERLKGEVPIVIGASRSFSTDTGEALAAHARFPFSALENAAAERSIGDFLGELRKTDFGPSTNLETNEHFDIEARNQALSILIQTSTGERIVN